MRVHVPQTGCRHGGREGFHQEVICELILKHRDLTDGKRHFAGTRVKAGGE